MEAKAGDNAVAARLAGGDSNSVLKYRTSKKRMSTAAEGSSIAQEPRQSGLNVCARGSGERAKSGTPSRPSGHLAFCISGDLSTTLRNTFSVDQNDIPALSF